MKICALQPKKFSDCALHFSPDYGRFLAKKCSQNHKQSFIIEGNIILSVTK
jgi:hypothetical protein